MLDLCIIVFLLFGVLIGFKQGFTRSFISSIGYIIVIIFSFLLKDPISEFLMLHLPFFDFYGLIKGVSVLNIAVYEIMSFGIIFSILSLVLKILFMFSSILEKILSMTIILGFPSKILGAVFGFLKNYVFVFAILFVLALPTFASYNFVKESKLQKPILENTPIFSLFTDKTLLVFDEFISLKEKYNSSSSSDEFNFETLELFLKYDIVKVGVIKKLSDQDKLHIKGIEKLYSKYGD